MKKVGVFVCHCGSNIAGVVEVKRVAEAAKGFPGVVFSTDYQYLCSDLGQELIRKAVKEQGLNRVVVASCSPRLHEPTFRKTVESAGLNPYLLEMVNIREQCSWVHIRDTEGATRKAIELVRMAVAKALHNFPLESNTAIKITKRALIIGAGIAGIQAALDIADTGYEVVLLDRQPSIGGNMVRLDKTFPTLDCSACICTPKMVAAAQHPKIKLMTYAEVEKVAGYVGNFEVTIRKKARSVEEHKCTGCGTCWDKCPTKVDSEFELGLGKRKAIYVPFPQAVPAVPVIDREHCLRFTKGKCGVCQKVCPRQAINYEQQDELITERFGAIIVATGYELFPWEKVYGEYGYGLYPDVITGMHFERLVNASGPTGGKILRPSDGKEPKVVVLVKCVGSRDPARGKSYCSRACCMYTAKHAHQVLEKIPDSQAIVFYMDVRTPGKAYEEFYQRTVEDGAVYVRGRVSRIYQEGEKLIVCGEDTLLGRQVTVAADLVVLAPAMVPSQGWENLAKMLGISTDKDGFFQEAHPKLRPVETFTAGIFLAGACQGPKDIPDTVAQAGFAAAKACQLLSRDEMITDPMIAEVDEHLCSGCALCQSICPYKAIEMKTVAEKVAGEIVTRRVATVNSGLCQGCGACTVACRSSALNLRGFTNEQILAEVKALCL
ncbi:MAG: 4Fe-4S binding protein [Moorellaceae bacterium]